MYTHQHAEWPSPKPELYFAIFSGENYFFGHNLNNKLAQYKNNHNNVTFLGCLFIFLIFSKIQRALPQITVNQKGLTWCTQITTKPIHITLNNSNMNHDGIKDLVVKNKSLKINSKCGSLR